MSSALPNHRQLLFFGKGSRYFGIWAVNVILTALTLGLYYPWAKTAVRKYIWNETELEGDRFVYHGTGKEMFKGFIIAYGIIFLLIAASFLHPFGLVLIYLGLFALAPVAIFGGWRYRLSRTSWRGIFFSFRGNLGEFVKLYFKNLFLTIITLGIYGSWMRVNVMNYLLGHSQFGQQKLGFTGKGSDLFGINILGIILSIFTLYIYIPWYIANYFNFTVDNTFIKEEGQEVYPLQSSLTGGNTFMIFFTNALLVMFTLGLGFPWANMRSQKLFTESVNLNSQVNLDGLIQESDNYKDATGDDLLDVLDIDLV